MITQNRPAHANHFNPERRLVLPVFKLSFGIKQEASLWRMKAQAAMGRWFTLGNKNTRGDHKDL